IGGLLLGEGCAELYNPKVVRSAMGSLFSVPVKNCFSLTEELALLKSSGYTVAAAALGGEPFFQASLPEKTVLIIGNEGNGVSDNVADMCHKYRLPMYGFAESLNAAVAAGILIYELARQMHAE
ncbi:MAG: RNA methyltransferase, partial [Clostridium sp.]|nr:RNA methyltransferase [Clostridium sp.]